jgi:hypothetical protein
MIKGRLDFAISFLDCHPRMFLSGIQHANLTLDSRLKHAGMTRTSLVRDFPVLVSWKNQPGMTKSFPWFFFKEIK